ncbi:MAG: hypothetical protein P1P84_08960 [Deferrisomatales bacterium]|nr:hypothetical protein [Deferrisomatales bacterium]
MRAPIIATSLATAILLLFAAQLAAAAPATRVANAIWAHDSIYDTVATDTTFMSPPLHSTDVIYSFMMSGLMGQRSVAEYAPGDREYNGGRWNVQVVVYTPAGLEEFDDGSGFVTYELTNAEAVEEAADQGLLTIRPANFYFECPLIPNRGHNR